MTIYGKRSTQLKQYTNKPKWEDKIDKWLEFPKNQIIIKHIRITQYVFKLAQHWIKTSKTQFPSWCPKYDSNEEVYDDSRLCPAHEVGIPASLKLIGQCIDRDAQKRGEPNPVCCFQFPYSTINGLLTKINKAMQEKNPDASYDDDELGCDLRIEKDPNQQGSLIWSCTKDDIIPLTKEEKNYTYYKLEEIIPDFGDETFALEHCKNLKESLVNHKYFVTQTKSFIGGNPLDCFVGDAEGEPYKNFNILPDRYPPQQKQGSIPYTQNTQGQIQQTPVQQYGNINMTPIGQPQYQQIPVQQYQQVPVQQYQQAPTTYNNISKQQSIQQSQQIPGKQPVEQLVEQPVKQPIEQSSMQQPPSQPPQVLNKPECFLKYDGTPECHICPVKAECMINTSVSEEEL